VWYLSTLVDETSTVSGRLLDMAIANGAYTGGGMNLTPLAEVNDGLFDVLFIHERHRLSLLSGFHKIYSGRHLDLPYIGYQRAKELRIFSEETVPIAADGEYIGHLPCTVRIMPGILKVRGVRSHSGYRRNAA